jgi:hypothetical protein
MLTGMGVNYNKEKLKEFIKGRENTCFKDLI